MVKIVFLIIVIILGLYFLHGFIFYGTLLAKLKFYEDEDLKELGLSRKALEYKRETKEIYYKIMLLFSCLIFSGFLIFGFDFDESITFKHGVKLW